MLGDTRKSEIFPSTRLRAVRLRAAGVWVAVVALFGITACGSASNSAGEGGAFSQNSRKDPHPHSQANPGDQSIAEMVAAVSATKTGLPVNLKFALEESPEVGQPVDVDVAVIPGVPPPEAVAVSFRTDEGLEIVEGAQSLKLAKSPGGAALRHTVKIVPKRDGIFTLIATVTVDQGNETLSRVFSIPVIAGAGIADPPSTPEAAVRPAGSKSDTSDRQ